MPVSQRESCAQTHRAERIAQLNDKLRITGRGGQVMLTSGVQHLIGSDAAGLLAALSVYDSFDPENDPHGERDFGDLAYLGAELLWKIDYYDKQLTYASPDPADKTQTARILTVMLAEEY